ncbi:pseudouridine synthase [Chitinophaga silvisoli]|uniref:Pseudouridine synthase n=1 Tax=Chitinophaga silvisoli TaxID=2291814 RepID=A0A3E1P3T0_9BACT|nr:pseudouridine synthase [Chitinophaga silvisoli]RFM34856.1 pseudouridine synthase [Chitinophaga silvisoli]
MKKKTPAKKGFAPFKENKSRAKGDDSRPGKRSAASGRPPRKDNDGEGFRGRKSDGEGFRPRKDDSEGFRARKSDGEGFRPRKDDGEGFRARKSDSEGFRPRKDDGEGFRGRKSDGEGFRPRKTERRPVGKDENGDPLPAFKKKEHTDGEESKSRNRIKAVQKTANGRTPFKPKPGGDRDGKPSFKSKFGADRDNERPSFKSKFGADRDNDRPSSKSKFGADRDNERLSFKSKFGADSDNERPSFKSRSNADRDDSAFHGTERSGKRGKDERDTPSGFNRKKYFDSANERFAAKQDRKTAARKARNSDSFSKKSDKDENTVSIEGEMPLNKYIAHCGLCSRRKAVDYVKEGKITVNGKVITEPAFKVTRKDEVSILGKKMHIQKNLVYILLNKPKGYITTTDDPEGRKTVMELIQDATEEERVYPVGRLDRNTSGLLLLTNDGELAQKLSHPKHNIRKIYHVGLNKPLTKAHFEAILAGVELEDGIAHVDVLGYVDNADKTQIGIEIHSGKNRIVRRIFEHLEYEVEKLDRVTYAGLTKKNINRGSWRYLTEKEIILLKHFK